MLWSGVRGSRLPPHKDSNTTYVPLLWRPLAKNCYFDCVGPLKRCVKWNFVNELEIQARYWRNDNEVIHAIYFSGLNPIGNGRRLLVNCRASWLKKSSALQSRLDANWKSFSGRHTAILILGCKMVHIIASLSKYFVVDHFNVRTTRKKKSAYVLYYWLHHMCHMWFTTHLKMHCLYLSADRRIARNSWIGHPCAWWGQVKSCSMIGST